MTSYDKNQNQNLIYISKFYQLRFPSNWQLLVDTPCVNCLLWIYFSRLLLSVDYLQLINCTFHCTWKYLFIFRDVRSSSGPPPFAALKFKTNNLPFLPELLPRRADSSLFNCNSPETYPGDTFFTHLAEKWGLPNEPAISRCSQPRPAPFKVEWDRGQQVKLIV